MNEVNSYSKIGDWYADYGKYVNSTRALPGLDGLKAVQRRILWSLHHMRKDTFIKSATVVGETIGKFHPHGDEATYGALVTMVNKRIIDGQGNWGQFLMSNLPPAAQRYTEVKLDKNLDNQLFELVDQCKIVESDIPGFNEPECLIVPIPVALLIGSQGIGVGAVSIIPAFKRDSLLKSYKENNPDFLEVDGQGLSIVKSDLKSLWETGRGSITYSYDCTKQWSHSDNSEVIVVEGSGHAFKPRIVKGIRHWLNEGVVWYRDESTEKIRIVVGKTKHIKRINIDDVYKRIVTVSKKSVFYSMAVYDYRDQKVKVIGIKDWLTATLNLYKENMKKFIDGNISQRNEEIKTMGFISMVADSMKKDIKDKEIIKSLGITKDQLSKIENFPLKYHRPETAKLRIDSLKKEIKLYESRRKDAL